jgi:carbon storage regulator
MALALSRRVGESIEIDGGRIVVTVVGIQGGKVQLGVEAPRAVPVHRGEVAEAIRAGANKE